MLSINIETQPLKMGFNSQKATVDITTTSAQLNMDTEAATVEIRQPKGKLEIDQTPCRYAYGIKNMTDFSRDNVQAGRDTVLETIGRTAEDGKRLAAIESGENAIANMAAESTVPAPAEITLKYIPLPDITFTPNPPQINWTDGKLTSNSQPGTVQGDFKPAQLDINVTQYPSIKIWTSENKIDSMV